MIERFWFRYLDLATRCVVHFTLLQLTRLAKASNPGMDRRPFKGEIIIATETGKADQMSLFDS